MPTRKLPEVKPKQAVTVSMTSELVRKLDAVARREGRTRSNLVELALRQYVAGLKVAA